MVLSTAGEGVILPHLLPSDLMQEYCRGFSESLLARVDLETRSQAKYLANQKESLTKES